LRLLRAARSACSSCGVISRKAVAGAALSVDADGDRWAGSRTSGNTVLQAAMATMAAAATAIEQDFQAKTESFLIAHFVKFLI
jgi:hypothetical protein